MAVEAGTRVGRFVIHEYLGQGDLGLLFRARGPNASSVAIKILRSLSGARVRARFVVLARRLGGLRHPNMVSVLDFGEYDDAPYLVLQYVSGGSLADLLRYSSISQPAALWVLRGIAAGIDHAHHSGLVHGALKPQQVVLDDNDHPMVTDFGLTPLRWPRPDGVTVAVPQRNADYTAPELLAGGQPTSSADRYAYATIAYQLLTGRTPFLGEPHDVMNAQLDAEPPPPSSVNPALNAELDAVLLRGLAKDPRARWQSCGEMVEALAGAVSPAGPSFSVPRDDPPARPPRSAPRPAGPAPGRPPGWRLGLAALAGAALLVGATVAWVAGQPRVVTILLSASAVHVGESFEVTATNVPAHQTGMIELHSDPEQIGTFKADQDGAVRVEVMVPEDTPAGQHVVTLCWEDGCHGTAQVRIDDEDALDLPGQGIPEDLPVASPAASDAAAHGARGTRGSVRPTSTPGGAAAGPLTTASPSPRPRPSRSPRPSHSPKTPTPSPHPSPSASPSPSPTPGPTPTPSSSPPTPMGPTT